MAKWVFVVPIPAFMAPARRLATRWWRNARRALSRKPRWRVVETSATIGPIVVDENAVENQIANGLDAGALFLLKLLQDETKTDGVLNVDFKQRLDAFKALNDYLVKRQKARENGLGDGDGMPPYEKIRRWLDEMGFEIVPKKKVGRPTKEELELRKKVLGEAEPEKPTKDEADGPVGDPPDSAMLERLSKLRQQPGKVANGQ